MKDEGSAAVEFLAVGVLLLVPIAYLVLTLGRVQAATFAAESAAREASRVVATAPEGEELAEASVALALADQGFPAVPGTLSLECEADPCRSPRARVAAAVRIDVDLPLVPGFLAAALPTRVPVEVRRVAVVDRFAS